MQVKLFNFVCQDGNIRGEVEWDGSRKYFAFAYPVDGFTSQTEIRGYANRAYVAICDAFSIPLKSREAASLAVKFADWLWNCWLDTLDGNKPQDIRFFI